jgi:hypothetical protein
MQGAPNHPREGTHAHIRQRIYRGRIDSPKTNNAVRKAALAEGLLDDIREWSKA